jgi:signal transduction histidine kinase
VALFGWGVFLGAASVRTEPALSALGDPWTEEGLRQAAGSVPLAWLRGYFLVLQLAPACAGLVAALLLLRGSSSWFRSCVAVALALFGTMNGAIPAVIESETGGWLGSAVLALQGLAWVALFPLMYVFPDGRIAFPWARWALVGWALLLPYFGVLAWLGLDDPAAPVETLPLIPLFGSAAYAAVRRYRTVSTLDERRQTRGVVAALVLWFGYLLLVVVTPVGDLQREQSGRGLLTAACALLVSYGIVTLIPAAITVGVLRHRLYDIDMWVNRTLVYATLSGLVLLAYSLVTLLATWWWQDNGVIGPVALAVLLGVAFQPLRRRVQRAVDRSVFGRRREPYRVLTELGRQLESIVPPDEVLATLVRQVCVALKLPYAAASLDESGLEVRWPSDAMTPPSGQRAAFPLSWQDEALGELVVVTAPGDELGAGDRELLDGLARQAGAAVRAATLNDDLRRSRERILGAREDEPRRLQRDLHDGLGPTLASLYQRVDTARSLLVRDPVAAEELLADVGEQTRSVVGEIRALVRALRPPELELGLASAVEAAAAHFPELQVHVDGGPLPELPPAVETAAYRIVVEAVSNAARHADASSATVTLACADGELTVSVVDDGHGLQALPKPGTGLRSMRERADGLGGHCAVTAVAGGGTCVTAVLPLREGET